MSIRRHTKPFYCTSTQCPALQCLRDAFLGFSSPWPGMAFPFVAELYNAVSVLRRTMQCLRDAFHSQPSLCHCTSLLHNAAAMRIYAINAAAFPRAACLCLCPSVLSSHGYPVPQLCVSLPRIQCPGRSPRVFAMPSPVFYTLHLRPRLRWRVTSSMAFGCVM